MPRGVYTAVQLRKLQNGNTKVGKQIPLFPRWEARGCAFVQVRAVCLASAFRGWLDEMVFLGSCSTGSLKVKLTRGSASLTSLGSRGHCESVTLLIGLQSTSSVYISKRQPRGCGQTSNKMVGTPRKELILKGRGSLNWVNSRGYLERPGQGVCDMGKRLK